VHPPTLVGAALQAACPQTTCPLIIAQLPMGMAIPLQATCQLPSFVKLRQLIALEHDLLSNRFWSAPVTTLVPPDAVNVPVQLEPKLLKKDHAAVSSPEVLSVPLFAGPPHN
jgi:hypothetical protein